MLQKKCPARLKQPPINMPGAPRTAPPLFARSNLQLNSFGQVSLSLSLSCLCLCLKPTWTGVSVSVSVLSLSLSLEQLSDRLHLTVEHVEHFSDMLQLSVEKESVEASVDCWLLIVGTTSLVGETESVETIVDCWLLKQLLLLNCWLLKQLFLLITDCWNN